MPLTPSTAKLEALTSALDRIQRELVWIDPRIAEAKRLSASTDKHDRARVIRLARSVIGCFSVTFDRAEKPALDSALIEAADLVAQIERAGARPALKAA
jgi:hypothetical protein